MMPTDLLHALGDIDNDLIEEAAPRKTGKKIHWLRYTAVAAAVVAVVATALFFPWEGTPSIAPIDPGTSATDKKQPESDPPHPGTDSTTAGNKTESGTVSTQQAGEVMVIPRWEDKTLVQRYSEVTCNGGGYRVNSMPITEIGERLGTVTVTGQDVYTEKTYTETVTLYAIPGIATRCGVAIQYAGDSAYYAAVNADYRPETLGQFLTDLNLRDNAVFGDAYTEGTTVKNMSAEDIFTHLLSDTALPNVYDQNDLYLSALSLCVSIPKLGIKDLGLWITEDGYLVTNLLHTGKAFYIGEDTVAAFIHHVQTTYPTTQRLRPTADSTSDGGGQSTPGYNPQSTTTQPAKRPE